MLNKVVEYCNASDIVILGDDADILRRAFELSQGNDELQTYLSQSCIKCWLFSDVIMLEQSMNASNKSSSNHPEKVVLFTSGTASVPKGCCLNPSALLRGIESLVGLGAMTPDDRAIVTGPGHHIYGFLVTSMTLIRGAGVIYAASKYSPDSVLRAASDEGCTMLSLVPSMIHSLLGMLEEQETALKVKGILVAGMAAAPSLLENIQQRLNHPWVENVYGMTEGVLATAGKSNNLKNILGDGYISAGKPTIGSRIRICHPDTGEIVSQGTPGQLVFSGPAVIDGYICQSETDVIFERDGHRWFNTGDEALIGKNGMIYILGRYKDIIVRGGENISMAKLEMLLAEMPEISVLQPQVVAATDIVAGEVPVLVTKTKINQNTVQQLKDVIRARLGSLFVPRDFVYLDNLGLSTYPLTTSGKTHKRQLAQKVREYFESQEKKEEDFDTALQAPALATAVVAVWARVLGAEAARLNIKTPVSQLADSMLMVSARDRIRKITGRSVALSDWMAAVTIDDQIKMLEASTSEIQASHFNVTSQEKQRGPLQASEMVHLAGEDSGFQSTKREVENLIGENGFGWDDVQDIFPCTDWIQLLSHSGVIESWNIRASVVSEESSLMEMRNALEVTLSNHPLMTSYLLPSTGLEENLGLHIVMRQNKIMLDLCITDYGTVRTVSDLKRLTKNYPYKHHPTLKGPLFHALMLFVEETSSAAVILNASHAIVDATSFGLFTEDLDHALLGQLAPHVPYQVWAESYYTLRKSPKAKAAVRYHTKQLIDLREHYNVLWPKPTQELVVSPERAPHDGHMISFSAPSFIALQQKYSKITPPIILQSALALVAMAHTDYSHALFISIQAARSRFPFLPNLDSSIQSFEAADVTGPTFNAALKLITLHPGETALQYLQRMQVAQMELTKYPSAPLHEVFRHLGLSSAQIVPAIANSLLFNWVPGLAAQVFGSNPFQHTTIQPHLRTRVGLLANAGSGGADGSQIVIWLHGAIANTSTALAESVAEIWKQASLWLVNEENWDKPAVELIGLLK
ncbi:hypothetical protein N7520_002275 [Penicillium odoratum]|uniref:uncharacterized protein n=1 Tax=Penicillium odoratum TaxID=1167516 RepID=UPI0025472B6C|nr:uncharacterized protein N7520_002275 [Penicillium odoratum]KAJ5771746.1 hypothetical protein N7520_002275 [Penicillium odoratum]